ncbi:MAG TPA: LysM peptidoglycan-binding domain-containing protein [Flavobacteriaceae bacterium]|nr:LysM peptidoglycan-binding domain-containing protein [Flavobacteriaceae bacterium]
MKKLVLILICILGLACSVKAQELIKHKVTQGETIETLAKLYLVTPHDILVLNPDAKKGLIVGTTLIIPISKIKDQNPQAETKELIGYKTIRVKRKETLYSLSKDYNVPVEDIKKYNTSLYSKPLRRGDKIRIPRYKTIINQVTVDNTLKTYVVQPKEGKWRIAYKFGMTIPELEALNPNMNDVLQPGDELVVKNIADEDENEVDEEFGYYTVQKSEGFMALNRKLGVTQEELEDLNPGLKASGLKLGMILKVPADAVNDMNVEDLENTNLSKNLVNFKTKNIALMLPFRLDRIDVDSIAEAKDAIKNDGFLSLSLDFESGVLIALDSAKQFGISTNLKVFDTEDHISEIGNILNRNDFSNYDAVIGPLLPKNLDRVASNLRSNNVPVISPFTVPEHLYSNVFQTIPSEDLLEQTIINYVKADTLQKNIVIIADEKHRAKSNRLKEAFPLAKQIFSKKNEDGKDLYYLVWDEIMDQFREGLNLVFLETKNSGFVSNVTSMLNGVNGRNLAVDDEGKVNDKEPMIFDMVLYTTNKSSAFDDEANVSNTHLSNLMFHYPSPNKAFDTSIPNMFVEKYKSIYGVAPSKYATRGFDLTLDILLRLASADDLYDASNDDIETEYVENKFRYAKKFFGGYYNQAVYVVKYQDMTIVEAKN